MEDKFWEEDALQESYIEFIMGDSDEEDSNSDYDISGKVMIKHSCCLGFFLIAAVSGGVGIRSPTWTTAGCCIFFAHYFCMQSSHI